MIDDILPTDDSSEGLVYEELTAAELEQKEKELETEEPHKGKLLAAIHKEKILAAINNPKAKADVELLKDALKAYETWIKKLNDLKSKGEERVREMTNLLNEYKDFLEVSMSLSCIPLIKLPCTLASMIQLIGSILMSKTDSNSITAYQ